MCYATPKKIGVYPLDRVEERFNELVNIARAAWRNAGCRSPKDPEELASLLMPDADSYVLFSPHSNRASERDERDYE